MLALVFLTASACSSTPATPSGSAPLRNNYDAVTMLASESSVVLIRIDALDPNRQFKNNKVSVVKTLQSDYLNLLYPRELSDTRSWPNTSTPQTAFRSAPSTSCSSRTPAAAIASPRLGLTTDRTPICTS